MEAKSQSLFVTHLIINTRNREICLLKIERGLCKKRIFASKNVVFCGHKSFLETKQPSSIGVTIVNQVGYAFSWVECTCMYAVI